MQIPNKPADEALRVEKLRALNILDTPPEERFDRLTRLACRLFGVPIALVSLVDDDRQWFKSCQGLDATETPRDISFCGHAILGDEIFIVPDAAVDERFTDNPLVIGDPQIRFYAGYPLTQSNGSPLGTLCLIDREPRELSSDDLASLQDLAGMAEQELAAVQIATMDELTSLSNRRGFDALARQALNLCSRMNRPASLIYFDLDLFKKINDSFGHAEGDHALSKFAALLKDTFRESDVIGRLGGDEFAVLLTNASVVAVNDAKQRLREAVSLYNCQAQRGYALSYSDGTTEFDPSKHHGIAELMAASDASMYSSKVHKQKARQIPEQSLTA